MKAEPSLRTARFLLPVLLAAAPARAIAQDTQTTQTTREIARTLPAAAADVLLADWRKIERRAELLERMGLADGDLVADVGAGLGWYSLEVAKRVAPHGAVFAVDIQQGMLDRLEQRMEESGIRNVYPVLGELTDPLLPSGKMDWVLLVDAYHEFSEPQAMLARIKESLAPGGRVALLEYRAEQQLEDLLPMPMSPELRKHFMSIEDVMAEWTAAGFELEERGEFLPSQHVFIFKAAGDTLPGTWRGGDSIGSAEIGDTPNLSTFAGDVYFAGQLSAEDVAAFAELEFAAVVNLRTEGEMAGLDFDEAALVQEAGMRYVHVPMGRELPEQERLDEVFDVMTRATAGDGKVLVHCRSASRVGALWAAFRRERHGLPLDETIAEGQRVGMQSSALEAALRSRYAAR